MLGNAGQVYTFLFNEPIKKYAENCVSYNMYNLWRLAQNEHRSVTFMSNDQVKKWFCRWRRQMSARSFSQFRAHKTQLLKVEFKYIKQNNNCNTRYAEQFLSW